MGEKAGQKYPTAETLRVLRILAQAPAHELAERPLRAVRPLVRSGLAIEHPWTTESHAGRWWKTRIVSISPRGRVLLHSQETTP